MEDSYFLDDYYGDVGDVNLPDKFQAFQILLAKKGKRRGGCSIDNDCLWDCLNEVAPLAIKKAFPSPGYPKQLCRIKRCDLVPLDKISLIEQKIDGHNIFISGEYKYNSTKEAKNSIYIKLNDEHFTVDYLKCSHVKCVSVKEKPFCMYKYDPKNK